MKVVVSWCPRTQGPSHRSRGLGLAQVGAVIKDAGKVVSRGALDVKTGWDLRSSRAASTSVRMSLRKAHRDWL